MVDEITMDKIVNKIQSQVNIKVRVTTSTTT